MLHSVPRYSKKGHFHLKDTINSFAPRKIISFQSILQLDNKVTSKLNNHPIVSWIFMLIGMPLVILLSVTTITSIVSLFYIIILSFIK